MSINEGWRRGPEMRIGIIGHSVNVQRENLDQSIEDLVFESVRGVLAETGLALAEIDTVVQAGDDVMDGIAINHVYTIEPAGALFKEESKVERDGAWAVHYAIARLLTGKFRTAMVVAFSKGSQLDPSAFSGMSADPFYLRPVGADASTIGALQAQFFMQRSGATPADLARVAVKNRANGIGNARVMPGEAGNFSLEDVLSAPPLAEPLTELSAARTGDGCTVMILAREDFVEERGLDVPFITGVGFISDAYYPTYREFGRLRGAEAAAAAAYRMAGTSAQAIDLAEVHDLFAHQELMLYEALGFCEENRAVAFLDEGHSSRSGRLPVNPSGGVLCGNVIYASGLSRMVEAALQLRGKGGTSQVSKASRALVHSQAGLGMQANIVYVLEA